MKRLCRVGLAVAVLVAPARAATRPGVAFPEPEDCPAQVALPDLLVMRDGRRVADASVWRRERRPELRALFQHYMYGHLPPPPKRVVATLRGENPHALDGRAHWRELRLSFGPRGRRRSICWW